MIAGRKLQVAVLASVLVAAPAAAQAGDAAEAGWGLGAALATLAYAPAKLVYATAGVVFGGVGWGLSGGDPHLLDAVIAPAVRGDYVVTPAHLRGERALVFVGPRPGEELEQIAREEAEADPWAYEY